MRQRRQSASEQARSTARRRWIAAGSGIVLVIVLLLVLVAAAIGLGHGFFASFVSEQSLRSVMGDVALKLCQDAITEAHFRFSKGVNDPEGNAGLFRQFREAGQTMTTDMALADLPAFAEELARNRDFVLQGEAVRLAVHFNHPASLNLPSREDRFGTLRFEATVAFPRLGVTRTLEETFDFKVNLTTEPRHFDCHTLFIANPECLVMSYAEGGPNETILWAMKNLAKGHEVNETWHNEFMKAASKASSHKKTRSMAGVFRAAAAVCVEVRNAWPHPKLEEKDPNHTEKKPDTLHLFPAFPFLLFSNAKEIDLGVLNLPDKVKARKDAIMTAKEEYKVATKAVEDCVRGNALGALPGNMQRYKTAALGLARLLDALLLKDYKPFQDALVEVGEGAPGFSDVEPFFAQMDADDLLLRASTVLAEGDPFGMGDGRTITRKLTDLLDRGPALSGLLYVKNPQEELTIDRTFRGRLVVVVEGNVRIQRALPEDPSQDLVSIVCFGRLTVEGPVRAGLVSWGSQCFEPGQRFEGNLIMRCPNFTSAPPARVMTGTLVRDERLLSGPAMEAGPRGELYPDYLHVALGPEPVFVKMERH